MAEQSRGTPSPDLLNTLPGLSDPYVLDARGIHTPSRPVQHREQDYSSESFELLQSMQRRHFWYRGRHRFLRHFTRQIAGNSLAGRDLEAIDLGAGCGGWVNYLERHEPGLFSQLSLGDSSATALDIASRFVSPNVGRYQIDLLNLGWSRRWDVIFLLDVLEHIPDDVRVLQEIRSALRPGGFLIMTTPALERFRTAIDDMSHHVRRYSRADLANRAVVVDMELVTTRYFMFLLSPLLLLSRQHLPDPSRLTPTEISEHLRRSSRTPPAWVNEALALTFSLETPLGAWVPFPWGTSVLAVLKRPFE